MWEKIVLNLLSNAFKFTFEGEIEVRLRDGGGQAELTVRDTGVGIPEPELPRLFERFHRIEGQRSRTYEGRGIGLALVQELVKLHGGAIRAESAANRGTTFTVIIPFGTAHLPRDRIRAKRGSHRLPSARTPMSKRRCAGCPMNRRRLCRIAERDRRAWRRPALREGARILFADDNADMRDYVRRLLGRNCAVQTVVDGEAALAAIRGTVPISSSPM